MDLYIAAADAARFLKWSPTDFAAVRRCLKPPLPIQRSTRVGRGKTPNLIQLEPLLRWLSRVLPNGLDADQAEQLANLAEPIT